MATPVLHVLAGPNGAGKTTFVRRIQQPQTHLPYVNPDEIAARHWPDDPAIHAYDASAVAQGTREQLLVRRRSFITETVFSHPSKVELIEHAVRAGYLVTLYVIMLPVGAAAERVALRVGLGRP